MSFAEKLKAARAKLGITQAEADALLKLGKGQFAAWESERNIPHEIMQDGVLARLSSAGRAAGAGGVPRKRGAKKR